MLLVDMLGLFLLKTRTMQSFLNDSKRKSNKIWVDKGGEFYNNSFKKWLSEHGIKMYFSAYKTFHNSDVFFRDTHSILKKPLLNTFIFFSSTWSDLALLFRLNEAV